MPEIETNKDKAPEDKKTHSTSTESEKTTAKEKEKSAAAPQKNIWDLPDGEFTEVFDSEGHRNRINHY